MTVIAMDAAPEGVRGELTRWFLELKPGVFIGKVNTRIRDLLWERICQTDAANGAVMAYAAPNEQGFAWGIADRHHNHRFRCLVDAKNSGVVFDKKLPVSSIGIGPSFPFWAAVGHGL